ncbi:glutathione S-transferase family protein [Stappia sediminis]|nr:glutathione S-transferase family protein [Stappia sediminis]
MNGSYRFFWAQGTACLAPQIVLEETGSDHEIVSVDLSRGEHNTPEYLKLNPAGTVPALVCPDGQVLSEAAALCLYLGELHPGVGLVPAVGDTRRGTFLRWLIYLTNTVQVAYKRFYYPERFSTDPAHAPAIKERAVENLFAVWRPVEAHLGEKGPYFLGEACSVADIYMLMLATWFEPVDDLRQACPAVAEACELMSRRPAVAKCLDMQNGISIGRTAHSPLE